MTRALLVFFWLWPAGAAAEQILVAVAANFADVARELATEFEQQSAHTVTLVIGATGKLYAQIVNGAPFDVLLAADQERPRRLEEAGFGVPGSRRTYAVGQLVLWSPDADRWLDDGAAVLRAAEFRRLAIANPRLAPYGAAAVETLNALGVYEDLRERLVMGENIAQAHAMVASGNANLGLIALSAVRQASGHTPGSTWEVPRELHTPIRQDAVLLTRASGNVAAEAFLAFLQGDFARERIRDYGYRLD